MSRPQMAIVITVLSLIAVLHPIRAAAQDIIPPLVQISGDLVDQRGKALSGSQTVTFALYKEQSGDSPLWVDVQVVTADAKGHFLVLLGASSPNGLRLDLFATGQARFPSMQAAGFPEQPRTFLASVPYTLAPLSAVTGGAQPVATEVSPNQPMAATAATSSTIASPAPSVLVPVTPPGPITTIVAPES